MTRLRANGFSSLRRGPGVILGTNRISLYTVGLSESGRCGISGKIKLGGTAGISLSRPILGWDFCIKRMMREYNEFVEKNIRREQPCLNN